MKRIFFALAAALVFSVYPAAFANDKIKVAFMAGFSGSDPNTAAELWKGLNAGLGKNSPFEVVRYDDRGEARESARLAKLATEQGAKVLIGIPNSDQAMAAAKMIAGKNVLFITPFATNPNISKQGDNVLQLCFSDEFQGEALARYASGEMHAKKILVLTNVESLYSSGLSGAFKRALSKASNSPQVAEFIYTRKALKLNELPHMIQAFQPDVIFAPDHIIRASVLIKKAHEVDPKIRFLGGDGLDGRRVFQDVFAKSKDAELYYTTHWHEDLPFAANKKFSRQYKDLFGGTPTSGAAMTWDGMQILLQAAQHHHGAFDAQKWLDYIRQHTFETTTGPLRMSQPGLPPARSAVLVGLKQGRYDYIKQVQ